MKRSGKPGERDLAKLLTGLEPRLGSHEYTFCTVPAPRLDDFTHLARVQPILLFREWEGVTLVLRTAEAKRLGLGGSAGWRRITLSIHSHLESVGLTAAIASALAEKGIAVNFIAGYYHDHVFVREERAEEAVEVLNALAAASADATA